MWQLLMVTMALLALAALVYLVRSFHKLTPFRRLGTRHPLLSWAAAAVPVALLGLFALINLPTMVVVILHLVLIWLLTALAAGVTARISGKRLSDDMKGIIAIGLTVIYLGVGWFMAHHVFETHYTLTTQKALPEGGIRIVEIADAHLGTTLDGAGFAAQLERVASAGPDAVVLAGDFVDDDTPAEDMLTACRALGSLDAPVYFAYGNHDEGYFRYRNFTGEQLRRALEENGVTVLADESAVVDDAWVLVGRRDRSMRGRLAASALTEGLDDSRYIVMLDHQPNDYAAEAATGADLVLSGHTHGGHLFPMGQIGVWMGANDSRYGKSRVGDTDFIVSSGISGWAVPIKTGTFSEFVVIDIRPEANTAG